MADFTPVVEFCDVTKVYGQGEAEVRALNGASFKIETGDFVAIMGPSGSGKSTAMNLIGCLDSPTSGDYLFNGVNAASLDRDQRALLRRNYLGFVFQGYNLLARTSALDNVELPMIYKGIGITERRERALEALKKVGLEGREHHDPSELSGGQQQRVAIARALVGNPDLILADEPTGNLDTKMSREIMNLLCELNDQDDMTIIMVTHEEDMAEYAHRLIWMVDGKVERDGKPAGGGSKR